MDIEAYLRQKKEHLGQQSKAVRDFSVFDFDYVPNEPLLRDEAKLLIDELLRFELTGIPSHHAIIGSRGSGKTLTLKYLQRILRPHTALDILYANCRAHNTSFKVLAHILGAQPRGASLAELFERFCATYARKTVVILDEVDLMSPKDPQREILYLLSRAEQPFLVLMLANNPQILKQLDPATRSSLQPIPLHFRHYTAPEITQILHDRAARGLATWSEHQLLEIAALTVRNANADARVAIKTLFYFVTRPGTALAECFDCARRDIVVDIIYDLSDPMLLILEAARSAPSGFARDIYARYARLCQARAEKAFSYVYFLSQLSYLQSVGLVALVATKVDRTYANRVLLSCDQPIVEQICRLRFSE